MKENLIHYRTCVCNINYHMVWSVKYRRKILNAEIEAYHQELVQEIAADKGFTVHLFECGEGDHVHCFVSAPPKLSITAIVKYLKGITGRKLFERFPEIREQLWKGELWNHSYYVETVGSVSEETSADILSIRVKFIEIIEVGNAAVKENIHKGQSGICKRHRTYVLCGIQALECL